MAIWVIPVVAHNYQVLFSAFFFLLFRVNLFYQHYLQKALFQIESLTSVHTHSIAISLSSSITFRSDRFFVISQPPFPQGMECRISPSSATRSTIINPS